jgi:hypothetical protein
MKTYKNLYTENLRECTEVYRDTIVIEKHRERKNQSLHYIEMYGSLCELKNDSVFEFSEKLCEMI